MVRIFIFLSCFILCSTKITIKNLDVPSAILYGSENDVTLDCDFDPGEDTVTEIKWFLDNDTQIYQWLPGTNRKAQAIGKLKSHIDPDYKATNDETTMYRALHLIDLSPELSGNYTCKVSGPTSEDVKTKEMIIYVTPDGDFDEENSSLLDLTLAEDNSQIRCSSGGFYPKPNMTLYIIDNNGTEIFFRQDDEIIFLNEENYFNVTATLIFDSINFTQSFNYTCELNLPGTSYNISRTLIHVLGSPSNRHHPNMVFLTVTFFLLAAFYT